MNQASIRNLGIGRWSGPPFVPSSSWGLLGEEVVPDSGEKVALSLGSVHVLGCVSYMDSLFDPPHVPILHLFQTFHFVPIHVMVVGGGVFRNCGLKIFRF